MNFVIEQILSADEAARRNVERAEQKATKRIHEAKQEAQNILTELKEHIRATEEREIVPIITTGHNQAQLTVEDTQRYIETLRQTIETKRKNIIETFINNILNTEK
ncbi:hypothetical protein [Desulfogranum marinum]|uniref:hypothetical protein n=1 Tax=Desulfogranum marinum TaxID=453220 RepID=UPI0029C6BAF8|nr:hypothetical protein [Desulfogranum marinum]